MMVPGILRRLTQDELADRWRMSPRSLERWRADGFGPEWIKMRGRVLYRIEDVIAFEQRHLQGGSD